MKFAVRLSILGVAFIVMFSIIGLRLWFVQVAEGPAIAQAAEEQTWLVETTHASRGDIYDRNNNLLVTSRLVPAVFVDRTFVQPEESTSLIQRLSSILAMDPQTFSWPVAADVMYARGGLSGIGAYAFDLVDTLTLATSLTDLETPPLASGFWYLVRPDCPMGSWQSTVGVEPERDEALP